MYIVIVISTNMDHITKVQQTTWIALLSTLFQSLEVVLIAITNSVSEFLTASLSGKVLRSRSQSPTLGRRRSQRPSTSQTRKTPATQKMVVLLAMLSLLTFPPCKSHVDPKKFEFMNGSTACYPGFPLNNYYCVWDLYVHVLPTSFCPMENT